MTIDAHCHVIAVDRDRYPRNPLGGVESGWSQQRPVGAKELIAAMDETGIDRAIVVQASTAYGHDNSYVADSVELYPDRFAGVFSVDMLAPDAPQQLAHWVSRGLQGARLFMTGSTMPGQASWLSDPRLHPAWEWAEENNLPLCLQMRPEGIPALRGLLDRFPGVKVLLDHAARPDLTGGAPYDEARELFDLAQYDGVYLKLTERTLVSSTKAPADPESFLGRLLLDFGAERLMWGSNYPAAEDDLPTLYRRSRDILAFLPAAAREQLFTGTADRLYPVKAGS
ncbi:amidohydrolase family protein [Kribbella sp. NPDC050281]|uniref:amidohydrolase family protein n=1 Tax=Kribbella sp. NPDC050281 TaxID=3155515 RepID=UPI003408250A